MPGVDDGELPIPPETPVDAAEPNVPDSLEVPGPLGVPVPTGVPDPPRLDTAEGRVPEGTPTTLLATDCPTLVASERIDATEEPRDAGTFVRLGTAVTLGRFVFERIPEGPKMIPVPLLPVVSGATADEAGAAEGLGDSMVNGTTPLDPAT